MSYTNIEGYYMKKEIKKTTFKLVETLLQEWMDCGEDKFKDAALQILEIIKGLK
jgi:hypothetical protein